MMCFKCYFYLYSDDYANFVAVSLKTDIDNMKSGRKKSSPIVWMCGVAAVILSTAVLILTITWENNSDLTFYVGTYGDSVYRYEFDPETVEFRLLAKTEAADASYVLPVQDSEGEKVFAVSERGAGSGAYSFKYSDTIDITADKRQTGADPCFVLLTGDQDSRFMMTADYSGGSISVFPVHDGIIADCSQRICFEGNGPVPDRQESSHIHQLKELPSSDGYKWILASDLGADKIRLLRFEDDTHILKHVSDIDCPAGSGPRHMEFRKDGNMLYCIAELSGEVLVYEMSSENEIPAFCLVQQIMADEADAGGSADIHIHPDGKWLYTSHRLKNDGISIFNIKEDGRLEKTGYAGTGRHPRNFMITPDGRFLLGACRDDRVIQTFMIEKDGSLTLTPAAIMFEKDRPSSVTCVTSW